MQDGFLIIKDLVYKADGKTKALQRPQASSHYHAQ